MYIICKWACCKNLVAPTNAIILLYCLFYPLSTDLVKYTTSINTLVFTPNSGADSGRAVWFKLVWNWSNWEACSLNGFVFIAWMSQGWSWGDHTDFDMTCTTPFKHTIPICIPSGTLACVYLSRFPRLRSRLGTENLIVS